MLYSILNIYYIIYRSSIKSCVCKIKFKKIFCERDKNILLNLPKRGCFLG